ncbi:MAG: hypothetical protein NTX96_02460 [Candidatus Zambryskibacteria bacterium]|nr:hypothetical protein [Candidatus Zambryskibacteria bacterium]
MMRNKTVATLVFLFTLFCVNIASAQTTTTETLGQRIERLKAEEAKRLVDETPEAKIIRLRAEQIRIGYELEKAREDVKRTASPAMRQALSEAERVQKNKENAKKAIERSGVTGCADGSVLVNPDAVPHWSIGSVVYVRVFNPEQVPVDIEDPRHGVVVRGLCSGGSLTLFRARGLLEGDYSNFRFVARAVLPDGRMALAESQTYMLSKYDWSSGQGQQEYDWTIQLRVLQQATR